MRLIFGDDQLIARWVASKIPAMPEKAEPFGQCTGIGVLGADEKPLAGVVFHDYQPEFGTIQMSFAAESPRWATKNVVRQLGAYPFGQLGVQKVWTAIRHTNVRAQRLVRGLGFTREATLGRHFGKDHAVIFRVYASDYARIYGASPCTTKSLA